MTSRKLCLSLSIYWSYHHQQSWVLVQKIVPHLVASKNVPQNWLFAELKLLHWPIASKLTFLLDVTFKREIPYINPNFFPSSSIKRLKNLTANSKQCNGSCHKKFYDIKFHQIFLRKGESNWGSGTHEISRIPFQSFEKILQMTKSFSEGSFKRWQKEHHFVKLYLTD